MTDVTEDGGCKTCNLANKQQENKFRLYLRGAGGWKEEAIKTQSKSSEHG